MTDSTRHISLIQALVKKAAEILPKGSQMALYGSRARGDARKDSDWDIHILIPGEEKLPLALWDSYAWPLADIGMDYDETVNPRLYSFSGWLKRSFLPFFKNVEKDKIIIFEN